jgi:hypothetical protein
MAARACPERGTGGELARGWPAWAPREGGSHCTGNSTSTICRSSVWIIVAEQVVAQDAPRPAAVFCSSLPRATILPRGHFTNGARHA